jgi:hypothetical protein
MAFEADLKVRFERLLAAKALQHAYLFFGEGEARQGAFPKSLARFVEQGTWDETPSALLDVAVLDAAVEGGIEAAGSIKTFLWQKPIAGTRRTAIITNADHLTVPAENAILKIAEEPPEESLILMALRSPDVLIPALVSRFQKMYISMPRKDASRLHTGGAAAYAERIIAASSPKARNEVLKELMDDESVAATEVMEDMITILSRDTLKNRKLIQHLLARNELMHRFNLNRKLQIEAAFAAARN